MTPTDLRRGIVQQLPRYLAWVLFLVVLHIVVPMVMNWSIA